MVDVTEDRESWKYGQVAVAKKPDAKGKIRLKGEGGRSSSGRWLLGLWQRVCREYVR